MLQKLKNLFKKKSPIKENIIDSTEDCKFINNPFHEEMPVNIKIAAQKIGLDLVNVKSSTSEITYGYLDFKIDETEEPQSIEETLFQMKKVKRASEKVLEKMIETEKQFNKSLKENGFKHEHSKSN